jgi:predicted porin
MKKASLAFAALTAFAGAACAQSSVTVYGILDTALVQEKGGSAGSVTKLSSGVGTGSRLGFRGTEDLGGGLSALFLLESGFQLDTGASGQGGLLFGRQAYVGLQGNLGVVLLGRQYTPQYLTVAFVDPFGSGWVGDTKNLMPATGNSASRMDNTVKYVSPKMSGLSVELAYGAGEVAGNNEAGRQMGAAIDYLAGPLRVRLGYHNRNNDTATVTNNENARNTVLAAVYDLRVVKAHIAYATNRGLNSSPWRNGANPFGYQTPPLASTSSNDALLGVTVPFGAHALLASFIYKDDKNAANRNANQAALGYRYALSKRTELNAAYSRIDNKNGASYTVGSSIEAGSGDQAYSLGIRHSF